MKNSRLISTLGQYILKRELDGYFGVISDTIPSFLEIGSRSDHEESNPNIEKYRVSWHKFIFHGG